MFERLKNWISGNSAKQRPPASPGLHRTGAHVSPRPKAAQQKIPRKQPEVSRRQADSADPGKGLSGKLESNGPGKNVLIRNKYVREDTGTHETLKILDDSMIDSGEEAGIDPYNTGGFDRSRNWDKRFGK